eukprot:TRINITY_DN7224_c0_g1_i1.p1 TRINITY_DN7224_c0_g1~~TRINITY_DN7224_c0_g1_i1.p1  ORF type:complete len:408 (+),score=81.24 TRINITY_DN7224_c0_g1_i1:145-1368(+)
MRGKEILMYSLAILIRLILILYGEWQDKHMKVKYTDIDYIVFSDASRFVFEGESPYLRSTYRYTPLLAWILSPNIFFHYSFGKYLFCLFDILIAFILHSLLNQYFSVSSFHQNEKRNQVLKYLSTWLFNPIIINVSTRGNAESIISLFVMASLWFILNDHIVLSAIFFGLSVHLKIYPIIYSLAIFFYIDHSVGSKHFYFLSRNRIKFFLWSASTFLLVTMWMFSIYGWEFLEETYLYHVGRKDIRHSFSLYFYYLYLTSVPSYIQSSWISSSIGIVAFLPQFLVCILLFTYKYYKSLPFCLFVQTFAFVTFNKVCTVQYFVWYFCFLPLVFSSSSMGLKKGSFLLGIWILSQGLWLSQAYQLEFLGKDTFFNIWIAGVIFFFVNVGILIQFIIHFNPNGRVKVKAK